MQRMILSTLWLLSSLVTMAFAQTEANQTSSVAGRVTREGAPIANVSVIAQRANQLGGWEHPGVSVKTDGDGRYHLAGLKAGSYLLSVRAIYDLLVWEGINRTAISPGKTVVLRAGESVADMDFLVIKGGVIAGTITDENGKPVVRAEVTLIWYLGNESERHRASYAPLHWYQSNSTDEQGRYRLSGLPAGKYLVRIGNETSRPVSRSKSYPATFYPSTTDDAKAKVIEIEDGGIATGIDIKLGQPEALFTAHGRIIDAVTGAPMVGVRIRYATLFSIGDPIRSWRITRERTNAQGEFQLPGLPPGKHAALLEAADAPDFYTEFARFEIDAADVKGVELKAARGSTITGIVTIEGAKSQTLPPDRNKLVIVSSYDKGELQAPTIVSHPNPDGSFRLIGLKPGNIRLFINNANFSGPRIFLFRSERNGVAVPDHMIPVRPGENVTGVRLVIGSGTGVVRGHLTFTGGTLPAGGPLHVFVRQMKGEVVQDLRPALVDAAGRFLFEGLLPGEYQFYVNAPGTMQFPPGVRQRLNAIHPLTVTADTETSVALSYDLSEEGKQ